MKSARRSTIWRRRRASLALICENLDGSGCVFDSSRIVLEKPIGHDLKELEGSEWHRG